VALHRWDHGAAWDASSVWRQGVSKPRWPGTRCTPVTQGPVACAGGRCLPRDPVPACPCSTCPWHTIPRHASTCN